MPKGEKTEKRKESAPRNGIESRPVFPAYFRAFFLFTFAFWEKRGIL
jgi:hypothetical protein